MATNKLLGYTLEETDNKIVITVDGEYATTAVEHLRAEMKAGRGWRVLSSISPMFGLARLERGASRRAAASALEGAELSDDGSDTFDDKIIDLNVETIFKQGFANPYDAFAARLKEYKSTLEEDKPVEAKAGDGAVEDHVVAATTRRRKKSPVAK